MEPFETRRSEDVIVRGSQFAHDLVKQYHLLLDKITPYQTGRWAFSLSVLFIFMLRVIVGGGWYIICYGLGIYYLTLFIEFISPKIDPDFQAIQEDLNSDSGPSLPTGVNDEFKPFVRRLPEYKFWLQGTKATLLSLFMSMFEVFDLPVFWPILVIYWLILTLLSLRKQIKHMVKHRYVPWTTGKRRYNQN